MIAATCNGVGTTLLVLGFFSLLGGISVYFAVAQPCKPQAGSTCQGYYTLSYGLVGGGLGAMLVGGVLDTVGTVYRHQARYALNGTTPAPYFALLPSAAGGVGGAAAGLGWRF
jgi:hypothetical protein